MCGIAGIVTWDEQHRITRDLLQTMAAGIAHRGPDGEGIFLTRERDPIDADHPQAGFVFRRLAILDPDPRAMQPFTIGDRTMVFNGEIYNFRELKAKISKLQPDYVWRTTGDSEVLLMGYAVWGEKCVEHLNGMFALAIWDEREKSLFLARDRMGQKPLYVSRTDGRIVFGSEVCTAILQPKLNLQHYLRYGYQPASFKAAMTATYRLGTDATRTYFTLAPASAETTNASKARELVERCVQRQLISDVPLGVFLSGGIDSSVIALCACKFGPVKTFTIRFDDSRYDESPYARDVAKHLGTEHHEFLVTPNAIEDLPKLAAVFGEPFADSSAIPTHYLSRETRRHVKVALSGDGGDELFGGYDRYRAMMLSKRISNRPLRHLATIIGKSWTGGHPKSKLTRAARLLSSLDLGEAQQYDSYVRIFDDSLIRELFPGADFAQQPDVEAVFAREFARTGDAVTAALATDRITYLPDDLLTKADRASMLHGLEVRSPFMDHELVQFAAGLTSDQLLKGGPKRMLREAFAAELPEFVFKRKKMGFAVPIGEWFRNELRPMLRDHLFAANSFARQHFKMSVVERLVNEHETARIDHSQRLYALLMLELWWKNQKN